MAGKNCMGLLLACLLACFGCRGDKAAAVPIEDLHAVLSDFAAHRPDGLHFERCEIRGIRYLLVFSSCHTFDPPPQLRIYKMGEALALVRSLTFDIKKPEPSHLESAVMLAMGRDPLTLDPESTEWHMIGAAGLKPVIGEADPALVIELRQDYGQSAGRTDLLVFDRPLSGEMKKVFGMTIHAFTSGWFGPGDRRGDLEHDLKYEFRREAGRPVIVLKGIHERKQDAELRYVWSASERIFKKE